MLEFLATGYSISQVTFVAFSLGAKAIAPLASRYITSKSSGAYVLPRLVGLDPGIVTYYEMHLVDYKLLNANDATFVMTVHTDCYDWGTIYAVGDANFWVNGGCKQPSCAAVFITNTGEFDGSLDELIHESFECFSRKCLQSFDGAALLGRSSRRYLGPIIFIKKLLQLLAILLLELHLLGHNRIHQPNDTGQFGR